jgi:hypothetical protein
MARSKNPLQRGLRGWWASRKPIDKVGIPVAALMTLAVGYGLWSGQPDQQPKPEEPTYEVARKVVQQEPFEVTPSPLEEVASFSPADKDAPLGKYHSIPGLDHLSGYNLKLVDKPEVNPSTDFVTVVRMRQADFERHLGELSKQDVHEEQWVYLPQRGLAIEIGARAKSTYGKNQGGFVQMGGRSIESDLVLRNLILQNDIRVISYHFHPSPDKGSYVVNAMPSETDMDSMFWLTLEHAIIWSRKDRQAITESKVVSPYGVADYNINSRGTSHYSTVWRQGGDEGAYAAFGADMKPVFKETSLVESDKPDHLKGIESLIGLRGGKYLSTTFTPFNQQAVQ